VDQKLLTISERLSSPPFFCVDHVAQSLVFCVLFCKSLFQCPRPLDHIYRWDGIGQSDQQLLAGTEKYGVFHRDKKQLQCTYSFSKSTVLSVKEMWHSPKHVTHNGPWSGILYYNLTTPNWGGSLIHQPGTHTAALWIRALGTFTT
jgi:hypothetical protein